MKRIIARVVTLCTAFEAIAMTEAQDDHQFPIINKCFQNDEAFSIQVGKCVALKDHVDDELDSLVTPLASTLLGDNPESDVRLGGRVSFPQCNMKTEILQYLSHGTFFIDDFLGDDYALTDLTDDDPSNYTSYCLERGYDGSQVIGTVALACKEVKMCEERLCISFCSGPPTTATQIRMVGENEALEQENIAYIQFRPPCGQVIDYEEFKLDFQSGSATAGGTEHSFGEFCLWENATKIAVCPPDDSEGFLKWRKNVDLTMMPILFAISLIFLFILFVQCYIKNRYKITLVDCILFVM